MGRPLRILHVVSFMSPVGGGAETWLMDVFRRIDRSRFRFDFLVHTDERLPFHDEVEALGGRLLRAHRPIQLWRYGRTFRRLVAEYGPYDVCHVHVPYCGYVLRLARGCNIPMRIAHGHAGSYTAASFSRPARWFLGRTNRWVPSDATAGVGCGRAAATALFGPGWEDDPRWRILYCGIDTDRFLTPFDRHEVRRSLGLTENAFVLGHVGRFMAEKNHALLLRVAAEVFRREPTARLLLVGDGELRPRMEAETRTLGIADKVVFAGVRGDVPDLLRAVDVAVLPSVFEALPLVGLEAQAAGVPVVYADTIPDEFAVVPGLSERVPLAASPGVWADRVLAFKDRARRYRPDEACDILARSGHTLDNSVRQLEELYQKLTPPRGAG